MHAGLDGIEQKMPLQPETDRNLCEQDTSLAILPERLDEALVLAQDSAFVSAHVPELLLKTYIAQKQSEIARIAGTDRQKAEHALYFHRI